MASCYDLSEAIVTEIAAREGIDPVELDVPLYEVVDVDALERLLESGKDSPSEAPITVEFTYAGYDVTVDDGGTVVLEEQVLADAVDETTGKGT